MSAAARKKKEHSLSMRLSAADIAIIDRAAELCGRSRMDFVREAAVRAAEEVLMEIAPIRMSPKGFDAFLAAVAAPAMAVPELVAALKRPTPWETSETKR